MSNRNLPAPYLAANAPMLGLVQRLSVGGNGRPARIVTFIAARNREGTSTVAREYAETLVSAIGQKVLLIDAGAIVAKRSHAYGLDSALGMVDMAIAGEPHQQAVQSTPKGVNVSRWVGREENRSQAGRVTHDAGFWSGLLNYYDSIVIDAPSLQSSFDGIVLATKANATVIVVEAEKTPQAVIRNLRDTLGNAGAAIAGVVLNKRKYYIPNRVYKKL